MKYYYITTEPITYLAKDPWGTNSIAIISPGWVTLDYMKKELGKDFCKAMIEHGNLIKTTRKIRKT